MATYYCRKDGSATKANAIGPITDTTKCMSLSTLNGVSSFVAGDKVIVSNRGGNWSGTYLSVASHYVHLQGEQDHVPYINGTGQSYAIVCLSKHDVIIDNFKITGGTSYGIRCTGSGSIRNTIRNIELLSGGGTYGIHLADSNDSLIENITIHDTVANGIVCSSSLGQMSNIIVRNVKISNYNHALGNNDGITITGINNFLVENCIVTSPLLTSGGGSGIDTSLATDGPNSGTIRRCFVSNGYNGFSCSGDNAADHTTFQNCISYNCYSGNWYIYNTIKAELQNCSSIGSEVQAVSTTSGATINLIMKNCVLIAGSADEQALNIDRTKCSALNLNNNIYSGGTINEIKDVGVGYSDLATWQTNSGQDSYSQYIDPLLDSDYTPSSSSPCIGSGAASLTNRDYYGRYRKDVSYDIGAVWFNAHEDSTII